MGSACLPFHPQELEQKAGLQEAHPRLGSHRSLVWETTTAALPPRSEFYFLQSNSSVNLSYRVPLLFLAAGVPPPQYHKRQENRPSPLSAPSPRSRSRPGRHYAPYITSSSGFLGEPGQALPLSAPSLPSLSPENPSRGAALSGAGSGRPHL